MSCEAISESKFSCNSNAQLITDGPVSQYQFKYQHKGTQEEDTAEYGGVEKIMKTLGEREHEDDKKETCHLICRAAFAHDKSNVVSAPLAGYLIRHQTRFYFSHKFQFCPLKDLTRLLNNQDVNGTVQYGQDGNVYFENQALHYLCRANELDFLSLKAFTEEFEITYATKKRKKNEERERYRFVADTGFFKHPSVAKTGAKYTAFEGAKATLSVVQYGTEYTAWEAAGKTLSGVKVAGELAINSANQAVNTIASSAVYVSLNVAKAGLLAVEEGTARVG